MLYNIQILKKRDRAVIWGQSRKTEEDGEE